jgi:hypothetical protein
MCYERFVRKVRGDYIVMIFLSGCFVLKHRDLDVWSSKTLTPSKKYVFGNQIQVTVYSY